MEADTEVKRDPLVSKVIKTEPDDCTNTGGADGGMNSAFQEEVFIPVEYSPTKAEPDEPHTSLRDSHQTEAPEDRVGNIRYDEANFPDCMYECCYCKILFHKPEILSHHLEDAHPAMEDLDSNMEKLANNTDLYKITTKPQVGVGPMAGCVKKKKKRTFKDCHLLCDYPGCGKTFIRRGALRTHQVVHEVSKECPHCAISFKTVTALLRHIDRKHNSNKSPRVDCTFPGCNMTFNNPLDLRCHHLVHDDTKLCVFCGMVFTQTSSLYRHIKTIHEDEAQCLTECSECGQEMAYISVKKHQQRSCVGRDGLKCFYPECGLRFYSKTACNNHERVHRKQNRLVDGTMPSTVSEENEEDLYAEQYECPHEECTLKFESEDALDWHLKYTLHHEGTYTSNPFHCPYKSCEQLFQNKESLCGHMKAEHWGTKKRKIAAAAKRAREVREAKVKPVKFGSQRKCPVCWETFPNESKMKVHLRQKHSTEMVGESDANSEQCSSKMPEDRCRPADEQKGEERGIANKNLVFDLKMYKCPLCQAPYHIISGLKYHLRHHHEHVEAALTHLCELESNHEAFLEVVPATLYGDSFKSRKRKPKHQASPKISEKLTLQEEAEKEYPIDLTKSKSHKDLDTAAELSEQGVDREDNAESLVKDPALESVNEEEQKTADKLDRADAENTTSTTDEKKVIENEDKIKNIENDDAEKKEMNTEENIADNLSGKKNNAICRYPSCFKVFQSRFELMRHQRTHEKLLKCPHEGCQQEFFSSNNLRLHIQLIHAEAQDTKCKDCGLVGKRSYIIYRHPKSCPKLVNLTCEKCGKSFKKVSSYTNHVRSHDKVTRLNYVCEYDGCEKKFRTRQDRTRHHNVHSGARPHCCPYANCSKAYKQRPHLLVHMKTVHTIRTDVEQKTYTCEHCGSVFKHSCGRLKHIKRSCLQGPNRDMILATRRRRVSISKPTCSPERD